MHTDILALENNGFLYLRAERKQEQYILLAKDRVSDETRRLFTRSGNELVFDDEFFRLCVNRFMEKGGFKPGELRVVLPHGLAWYHYLELDNLPKNMNEATEFVMWKIQKILPIPREQVELRLEILSRTRDKVMALAVVTYKTFVVSVENALRSMGIVVPHMTTATIAFLNFFGQSCPGRGIMIWLREKGYSMVCYNENLPVLVRELDMPVNERRLEVELYNFSAMVKENFAEFIPEKILYFDEIDREGLFGFLGESAGKLDFGGIIQKNTLSLDGSIGQYVYACGAVE